MKRLLIILALIIPVCICAQQKLTRKQKKYLKLAQQLDILDYLPDTTDFDPSTFWNCVTKNNAPLQEELAKFRNPKDLARQAYEEVEKRKDACYMINMTYDPSIEGELNSLYHQALIGNSCLEGNIMFRVRLDDEINAFCTPDGWVYINEGLIYRVNGNYTMVLGVLAHEVAHYMFKHMLIHEHMALKRKRANSIVAAIALIGVATANAVAASKGAMMDSTTVSNNYQNIVEGANEWSTAYRYRYGRENELMSDIAAYRFLEYTGRDPEEYIKVLEILDGYWMGDSTDRYDDHPSPKDRIGVLRALPPAYRIVDEESASPQSNSNENRQ